MAGLALLVSPASECEAKERTELFNWLGCLGDTFDVGFDPLELEELESAFALESAEVFPVFGADLEANELPDEVELDEEPPVSGFDFGADAVADAVADSGTEDPGLSAVVESVDFADAFEDAGLSCFAGALSL